MRNDDRNAITRLRSYYAKNFKLGHSDASFVLWVETMLEEIREADRRAPRLLPPPNQPEPPERFDPDVDAADEQTITDALRPAK